MGLIGLPDDFDTIPVRKQRNHFIRNAQKVTKPDKCILCGQPKTSYCNSHSVPQMILRSVADNGILLQANVVIDLEIVDDEKGINNSGTFRIICNDCDSKYFQDYENPDSLKAKPDDKMMAEIALKDVLIQLYKRRQEIEMISSIQAKQNNLQNFDLFKKIKMIDLKEYEEEIIIYKDIIEKDIKGGFQILYWKLLPYKTPIAAQSMFALLRDRDNRLINNVFDESETVRMQNMHIGVFPMDNGTAVIAFYHKRDKKYRSLRHQFNTSSDDENLKYINWLVFKYTENYFFSKTIQSVLETDEILKELSQENNEYPNLGIVDTLELLRGYNPVTMDEIPNFLDASFAI